MSRDRIGRNPAEKEELSTLVVSSIREKRHLRCLPTGRRCASTCVGFAFVKVVIDVPKHLEVLVNTSARWFAAGRFTASKVHERAQ
jgi:hypothetical protein